MGYEPTNATLAVLPLHARRGPELMDWMKARQRLGQIANLRPGWNAAKGAPPDPHTMSFAAKELAGLERLGIPAPTINPSADGALYAEWHMLGLDIELIFEAPYKIVVLIEDARKVIPRYDGEVTDLGTVLEALGALCAR